MHGGTASLAAGGTDGGRGFDGRSFLPVLLGKTDTHQDVVYGAHTTRGIINGSPSYPIRSIRTPTHKLIWNLQHDAAFQNVLTGGRDGGAYWLSWIEKAKTDATAARFVNDYQRRPEFELYDLAADPYELNNLADDPANRKLRDALYTQLQAWMKQQGDQGIPTELKAKERQGRAEKKPPKEKKNTK
ncbi:MAG: DUF4976 domain-containing protein [Candidatus Nealsonbacteria bacterium]|nr:DUF4976 domain-containing protein [Candidatus Nealsonbacteria bacterium]